MKRICSMTLGALSALIVGGCSGPAQTIEHLKAAACGSLNAKDQYAAFSARAAAESMPHIATMFAATSASQTIHADNFLDQLAQLAVAYSPTLDPTQPDSTLANLYRAKNGGQYKFLTMYPELIETAVDEKNQTASHSFQRAAAVEKTHADHYIAAIQALESGAGDQAIAARWYVCPTCGNTYNDTSLEERCSVCETPSKKFTLY